MMTKIECSQIEEGVRFTKPVFFDDMQNMFLCANRPAKKYHVVALKRWKIPFLYTEGTRLAPETPSASQLEIHETFVLADSVPAGKFEFEAKKPQFEEIQQLDELEELEEI